MPIAMVASACGSNVSGIDAVPGDGPSTIDASVVDPLIGIGTVETVETGFMFTEGPQWREAEGDLLFTDLQTSTVHRYVPGGSVTIHRMPSNVANGLAIDGSGLVIAAEHMSRSVTRADGNAVTTVVDDFEGDLFHSPNDVVVDDVGAIYFTDPPYGGNPPALTFNGVFRVAPGADVATAEYMGATTERPNGIGISPGGETLYVADTADGGLFAFPIDGNGALGVRAMLADTSGGADGLAIDTAGNIFVTANDGVEVFAPDGTRWGVIEIPEKPSNCAFGDVDHRTLYVTAISGVYRVRVANPGLPRR
jgi:gluconolactonase